MIELRIDGNFFANSNAPIESGIIANHRNGGDLKYEVKSPILAYLSV